MRNFAYTVLFESDPFHICEDAGLKEYSTAAESDCWTEDELSRIRMALRRSTLRRVENPEDAEDLVQDTLLTMIRKAPNTDVEKGMMIWAMGILRRKVGNYYRRTQRFMKKNVLVHHALGGAILIPSPESSLHHSELIHMVDGILVNLSPQERTAIDLYLGGRQTSEIVALLHPERYQNTVNRLHRGRKKLVRELARLGYMRRAIGKRRRKNE
jgi:RNA polymerase sigma factor (sigma-70 family)